MHPDPFEFNRGMTWYDRAWRVLLLLVTIAVLLMDLLVWRPA